MIALKVILVTPERRVFERAAVSVTLPVADGEVTLLPEHMPYIGALRAGEAILRFEDGAVESLAFSGGFVEFDHDTLTILADTAERAEDIDMARAEAAKARAEALRAERVTLNEEEYASLAAALDKELARIKVAHKHRTRTGPHIISDTSSE